MNAMIKKVVLDVPTDIGNKKSQLSFVYLVKITVYHAQMKHVMLVP